MLVKPAILHTEIHSVQKQLIHNLCFVWQRSESLLVCKKHSGNLYKIKLFGFCTTEWYSYVAEEREKSLSALSQKKSSKKKKPIISSKMLSEMAKWKRWALTLTSWCLPFHVSVAVKELQRNRRLLISLRIFSIGSLVFHSINK